MPFSDFAKKAPRTPGRTLVIPPSAFADEWKKKPKSDVCVGIRLLSEADKSRARAEAERVAFEHHERGGPNWVDCFNDVLVRQAVALGMCDPNDVERMSDLMELPEEEVAIAFTSSGARFVFEAIERYEAEVSPVTAEASDADVEEFLALMYEGGLGTLSGPEEHSARRLIAAVLDDLRNAAARAA